MADLYINPQGYVQKNVSNTITGNKDVDTYLNTLPTEERASALKEIQAPLTGEEVAQMLHEDANWRPNKQQFDAFSTYQAHKETSLFEGMSMFGEALGGIYDIAGNVISSMYNHPLEDAVKLVPSLLEGGVQNIRNWYGMAAQSQDPSSSLFKFKNALARDGSDGAYRQFLEARDFARESIDYETGKKTILVNKDYVDPALVQAATIIVDPMFYGSFLVGAGEVGIAEKVAQILGMSERLAKAGAFAEKMKGAVYGGALKYGVGVPLEFIGDITRGTIDKTLEAGSNILEGATGVSAQELKQAAKVGGFGSMVAGVPVISPTSKVYLGAGFAGRLGEAIGATGEQIMKNGGKRGLLSFAGQAIEESDAILAKGGAGLSPQARKLLGVINKVDPMFSYAGAWMEGGVHGAVIGAGLGALGGGEDGAWSGAGAGFGIGSIGGVAGRAMSNIGGGLEKQRLAVQMEMLMPMLKDVDPTTHSSIELLRKANRAAGNPDWVVDRYIVALDKIAPEVKFRTGGAKENEAQLRAKGQDPKVYDGFERDAKGDYVLDKDGNKTRLRDAEGHTIPTMKEFDSAGWTIREDANGKIKVHINTDKLGDIANTLPHEMFHGIFRELGMKSEFQDRINEHILGTFDENGKQIKPPSISKYEAESFFTKYINNAYTGNDKTERLTKVKEALNEYYTTGKMTVMESDGKTPVLSHLTEEFGAYYWTQFLNDKPVDYLFRGGDLGGVRNAFDSVKNKWQDYMERKVGRVNGGFDFARDKYINPSFLDKDGKRVRVSALDYMMQDLVKTKSAASKGQAFDFNNLSPEGQRAYVEASGNSVAFEPPAVKGGKYKVRSETQQAKIRAKNGEAMHKGLDGFRTSNPDILRIKDAQGNDIGGLSVDADGNYVGTVPDAILDYFVKSGHIDKVEAERIKILQKAARGETPSNVFEFTDYTGATMHTGVGSDIRAVSPNVPTKSRLVIVTDFSAKISPKDYGFYAHTLDYRHLELRADNSWKDPKVRAEWGDDRDAFISDLFRYFKNASLPDGQRLPSAQLWTKNGEYKRNIMHDVSGVQTPAAGTINTANAPIAGDMLSTFRKFRTDRMTQERMSGEKIDLRGDNAIDYIRHNMMPSEMSDETTPNGKIWTHPSGYKFLQVEGGIKAVKPDGTIIGKFGSMEEAVKKADAIYQKENPNSKPIASLDNIRNEPADAPETQAQYTQRKIDSFYERPESVLDIFKKDKDGDYINNDWDNFYSRETKSHEIGDTEFETRYGLTKDQVERIIKRTIEQGNNQDSFATDFIDYPLNSNGRNIKGTIKDIFNDFFKDQYFKEQEANNPTFVSGLSVALDKILPANVNKEGTIQASRLINLMKSASGGDIGKILTEANSIGFTEYLKSKGQQRISVSDIKDFIDKNGIKVSIDPRTDIRGNEWMGGGFDTSKYVAEGKKDGYYTFVARINQKQAHGVEGHFGGDTIAHIRATIRTDAQGRKVLFIEEIQSINTNANVLSEKGRIKTQTEIDNLKAFQKDFAELENYSNALTKQIHLNRANLSDAEVRNKATNELSRFFDKQKELLKKHNIDFVDTEYDLFTKANEVTRLISERKARLKAKKNNKPLQEFNETVKIASRTIMRKAVELGAERVVLVRPEDMHPDVSVNAEGERFVDAAYGKDIPMMIDAELKKYGQQLRPADNISKSKAYKSSDTHDTHILLSKSLGYDITPEMKQKAGRSQTFMMPSEGEQGGKYTESELKRKFIGKYAQQNPDLADNIRLEFKDSSNYEDENSEIGYGRKVIELKKMGEVIGKIKFELDDDRFYKSDKEIISGKFVKDIAVRVNPEYRGEGYQHLLYSEMFERARDLGAIAFRQEVENSQGLPLKSTNKIVGKDKSVIWTLNSPDLVEPTQDNFNSVMKNAPILGSRSGFSDVPAVSHFGELDPNARYMPSEGEQGGQKYSSKELKGSFIGKEAETNSAISKYNLRLSYIKNGEDRTIIFLKPNGEEAGRIDWLLRKDSKDMDFVDVKVPERFRGNKLQHILYSEAVERARAEGSTSFRQYIQNAEGLPLKSQKKILGEMDTYLIDPKSGEELPTQENFDRLYKQSKDISKGKSYSPEVESTSTIDPNARYMPSEGKQGGRSLEIPKKSYEKPLSGYVLVSVNPKEINDLHLKSNPNWSVKRKENQIETRVQDSKNYITNKGWNKEKAEAPRIGFTEDGKLSIANGRHRLVASEELGIQKTFVQVPENQVNLFKKYEPVLELNTKENTDILSDYLAKVRRSEKDGDSRVVPMPQEIVDIINDMGSFTKANKKDIAGALKYAGKRGSSFAGSIYSDFTQGKITEKQAVAMLKDKGDVYEYYRGLEEIRNERKQLINRLKEVTGDKRVVSNQDGRRNNTKAERDYRNTSYMPSEGQYRSSDNYWKAKDNKFEGVDADGRTYRLAYAIVNGKTEYNPEDVSWFDIGHSNKKGSGMWGMTDKKEEIMTFVPRNLESINHGDWGLSMKAGNLPSKYATAGDFMRSVGRYEKPVYDKNKVLIKKGKISMAYGAKSLSEAKEIKTKIASELGYKADEFDAYIFGDSKKTIGKDLGMSLKDQLPIKFMPAEQAEAWRNFQSEKVSDGNSIFKNAMNYVIIQANNKYKVYNPQKELLGIYTDLDGAKRRVQREEPKQR